MSELHPDEPLDEGYWQSLGAEGGTVRTRPPADDINPFEDYGDPAPNRGSRYKAGWLQTKRGVEFIDVFVGELPDSEDTHALVFLYEVLPGRFNVGICPPKTVGGGRFLVEDVDYQTAKDKAERAARGMSVDAGLNAEWRDGVPSRGQLNLIMKIGLDVDSEIVSKGQASDLLNVHFASRTLDPAFARS